MFGKWTAEVYDQNGTASYIDKTTTVNNVSTDVVLIVGEKEGWELIGSEMSLDFDYTENEFDMKFRSLIDNYMTLLPALSFINLQVKVDPGIRNDTNRTNTSPVVLVKPLYSLELGKIHTIHLTSVDNDGDAIRCDKALYEESSGMGSFVENLKNQNIFSLDRVKCVMKISVNQRYFNESDTFGVAITVKDYSKHNITIQGTALFPYISVLGRVVVMMYFKITGRTDPPEIIPPTPSNNQEYTIYVGGDFHVDVYAEASAGKHITRFDFLRRDGKPVNHTGIQPAANISSNAVFISMSWSPTEVEKGHHILCANAEDNQGIMTVDLHCFRILVKENIFRPTTPEIGKPYFVSFPEPTDLSCKNGTYCRFPVYAFSSNSGGITNIVSTPKSEEIVTIQYSRELINGTIDAKVAQVEFLASQAGARQICLKALDSLAYAERCLYVTVELPDPCASDPCQHSGQCYSFDNNTKYTCSCTDDFTGLQCEKKRDFCDPNPCLFNGQCTSVQFKPFFFCTCINNSTGDICQIGPIFSQGVNTLTTSSQGVITLTTSSQGVNTLKTYSQGVNTPTTSSQGVNTPTTSSQGINTPITSSQGVNTPTTSGQGVNTPTTSSQGINTPTTSSQGINTPTTSSQGVNTPTTSSIGVNTPSTSSQGVNTPTPSSQGVNTAKTSGQGVNTPTTSSQGVNTPTTSSQGVNTPTTSGQGVNTPTKSGLGINTPTKPAQGVNTPTTSGLGVNTPTTSGLGINTPTTSGHGLNKPQTSDHYQTNQTVSNSGARLHSSTTSGLHISNYSGVSTQLTTKIQNPTATGTTPMSHCNSMKVKERATNGRVECFCPHPSSDIRIKVITLNPRVSLERLLLAAGLGSGAMIIILGLVALLYVITQKCSSPHKTHTELNPEENQPIKKISTVSMTDKKK
ncbi:mucin-2-like [Saccostrea cucullata]|uniref:mucin-2-like n=1 Tax=Saccostrea cuccullata TaxID=36930 RepID=UPI002ED634FC